MIIEQGAIMLELQIDGFGGPQTIHPTLVWDGHDAVLIDTGTPGQWGRSGTKWSGTAFRQSNCEQYC